MGRIYRAEHVETGREVALKVIRPQVRDADRLRLERSIGREVAAVARLHHRRIVEIYDFGRAEEQAFFAMELTRGSLTVKDVRSWPQARAVLLQVLDGLAHAHARGVLHRDLKPDNILVRGEMQGLPDVCLTDFGIAYAVPKSLEDLQEKAKSRRAPVGTPTYMAPEQALGEWRDWGPWTDLYAVGCIAYELVTGRPPFAGSSVFAVLQQHVEAEPPPLEPRFAVPRGLQKWVGELLLKDPYARYGRAAAAARGLGRLHEAGPVVTVGGSSGSALSDESAYWDQTELLTETLHLDLDHLKTQVSQGSYESWKRSAQGRGLEFIEALPSWRRPGTGAETLGEPSLHELREPPLRGRVAERGRMWEALQEAIFEGQPRFVVLRGEAGMGVSATARWVAERAHELGVAVTLEAFHGPGVQNARAISEMFARLSGCLELDEEGLQQRVRLFLERYGDPRWIDEDASILTAFYRPAALREGAPSAVELVDLYHATDRVLGYLCGVGPLVMVLDEVQWGRESLIFARHLDRMRQDGQAVLVVLAVGEEELADRPAEAHLLRKLLESEWAEEIRLGPLDDEEMEEVLDTLGPLPDDLRQRVKQRAKGSPVFARQLVAWIHQSGDEPGRLPEDIAGLWRARLAELWKVPGGEAFLTTAAAFGLEVRVDDVLPALEWRGVTPPEDVDDLLEVLVRQGAVVRRQDRLFFAQSSLRKALVEWLENSDDAADVYRACAAVRTDQFISARDPMLLEQAGEHLERAGAAKAAFDRYSVALRMFRERRVDIHAREALQRMKAIEPPYQLGQEAPPSPGQQEIALHDVGMEGNLHNKESAREALETLVEIEERLGMEPSLERRMIETFLKSVEGRYQETIDDSMALLLEPGLRRGQRFVTMQRLVWCHSLLGEFQEAREFGERAISELEAEEHLPLRDLAEIYLRVGRSAYMMGDPEEALDYAEKARQYALETCYVMCLADIANLQGDVRRSTGDLDGAERAYTRALQLAELAGDYVPLVEELNLLIVYILQGKEEAVQAQDLAHLRDECVSVSASIYLPYLTLIQTWEAISRGCRQEAQTLWAEAVEGFRKTAVEPDGVLLGQAIAALAEDRGWEEEARNAREWAASQGQASQG